MIESLVSQQGGPAYHSSSVFRLDPSDQPAGSTIIVDKSANAVSVTNSGVVVSNEGPSVGVKSMFFNKASTTYLRIPGGAMPNVLGKNFQIDYLFKPDNVPTAVQAVIAQWMQTAGQGGFLLNFSPSGQMSYNFGPYNTNGAMITAPLNPNRAGWVKYSMRRKANVFEMWQNDVLVGSFTSALVATMTLDWVIGSYMNQSGGIPATGTVPLAGWMADLQVYDYYKG